MFEQSLVAVPRHSGRATTFAVSTTLQVLVVGTLLLAPLFLIERPALIHLDARLFAPPRPSLPSVKLVEVPKSLYKVQMDASKIFLPAHIPPKAAQIVDDLSDAGEPRIEASAGGVAGAIGDPNNAAGALSLFQNSRPAPPPPEPARPIERTVSAPAQPDKPVRVGGEVQEAKLLRRVLPVYPALAKAARISGTVRLLGILSRDGHIRELRVLSGPPLLVAAAVEAVKQWVYKPTLLNSEPVEVISPIEVHFRLN